MDFLSRFLGRPKRPSPPPPSYHVKRQKRTASDTTGTDVQVRSHAAPPTTNSKTAISTEGEQVHEMTQISNYQDVSGRSQYNTAMEMQSSLPNISEDGQGINTELDLAAATKAEKRTTKVNQPPRVVKYAGFEVALSEDEEDPTLLPSTSRAITHTSKDVDLEELDLGASSMVPVKKGNAQVKEIEMKKAVLECALAMNVQDGTFPREVDHSIFLLTQILKVEVGTRLSNPVTRVFTLVFPGAQDALMSEDVHFTFTDGIADYTAEQLVSHGAQVSNA